MPEVGVPWRASQGCSTARNKHRFLNLVRPHNMMSNSAKPTPSEVLSLLTCALRPQGRTKAFSDHMPAFAYFGFPASNSADFRQLVVAARRAGLDTLQFTHRCVGSHPHRECMFIVDACLFARLLAPADTWWVALAPGTDAKASTSSRYWICAPP